MQRYFKILFALGVFSIPLFIWCNMHRTVHPKSVINQLHAQFDHVSFISIDYRTSKRNLLGMDYIVYTGVLHVNKDTYTEKYQFIADAYSGEIMEITLL
ncbi:hypothetical protein [Salinicoccus albus]|uniref:hypothetical protein n=1 Tax=Salinicoccus albus TaxID=418756 RepID=UPI0003721EB7|nr:hypothetical protein [Salinicoccus albus]